MWCCVLFLLVCGGMFHVTLWCSKCLCLLSRRTWSSAAERDHAAGPEMCSCRSASVTVDASGRASTAGSSLHFRKAAGAGGGPAALSTLRNPRSDHLLIIRPGQRSEHLSWRETKPNVRFAVLTVEQTLVRLSEVW